MVARPRPPSGGAEKGAEAWLRAGTALPHGRASPVGFPPAFAEAPPTRVPLRDQSGCSLPGACAPSRNLWGGSLFPVAERRARSAWFPRRRSGDPNSMVPRRRDRKAPAPGREAAPNPELLRLPLRRSSRGTSLVLPPGEAVALAAHNNPELTLKWRCRPAPRPPGLAGSSLGAREAEPKAHERAIGK